MKITKTSNRMPGQDAFATKGRQKWQPDVAADRRLGFTLVELIGTCFLLGILFSIMMPMLSVIARERRSTQQRQFALQHAANLLERATDLGWDELQPGELTVPAADANTLTVLPEIQQRVTVRQISGEPASRQVVASIQWQNYSGRINSNLELSAWVYPTKEVPGARDRD